MANPSSEIRHVYYKRWRAKNHANLLIREAILREANREKIRANSTRFRETHREEQAAYHRKYRAEHPDKCREIAKRYATTSKDVKKAWHNANPEKVRSYSNSRRARHIGAEGRHCGEDIKALLELQCNRCSNPICGVKLISRGKNKYHIDHIQPLARGGSNWPSNLQLLCPACNRRKSSKESSTWAQDVGLLFTVCNAVTSDVTGTP